VCNCNGYNPRSIVESRLGKGEKGFCLSVGVRKLVERLAEKKEPGKGGGWVYRIQDAKKENRGVG